MVTRVQRFFRNALARLLRTANRAPRLVCWFLVMYGFDAVFVPIVDQLANNSSGQGMGLLFGIVIGQCAIVAILGALYGTSWIDGFVASGLLIVIGMLVAILGGTVFEGHPPRDIWAIFGFVPGIMFAVYAPLLAMRHFANWRLIDPTQIYAKQPADLVSIFLNTAMVAVILMALRAPQAVFQVSASRFWFPTIIAGLVMVLVSSVVTLPLAAFVLNCGDPRRRILRIAASGMVALAVFALCMTVIGIAFGERMPMEFYLGSVLGTVGALSITYYGIWAIRNDGFRLRTKTNDLSNRTTPQTEAEKTAEEAYLRAHRKQLLACVLSAVLLMIGLNAYLSRVHSKEANFARGMLALRELVDSNGGRTEIYDNQTFGLKLIYPPRGDQSPDRRSAAFRWTINVFNAIIQHRVHEDLVSLDLSELSDDRLGLGSWNSCTNLKTLDISNSNTLGVALSNLRRVSLEALYAKNTDLSKTSWDLLNKDRLRTLVIDGSAIDAGRGLAEFLQQAQLERLSMNDVRVAGDATMLWEHVGALDPLHLLHLSAAGADVYDEFIDQLASHQLRSLDLSRTQVTDASAGAIARCAGDAMVLRLAGTKFTDVGVAKLMDLRFVELDLSETEVTDLAFRHWSRLPTEVLDLSDTAVGDGLAETLFSLRTAANSERVVNLSGTKITNAILPTLSKLHCKLIDVSDTAINAQGFRETAGQPSNVRRWRVGEEQFTSDERDSLASLGFDVDFE